jgi:hypothetical protein
MLISASELAQLRRVQAFMTRDDSTEPAVGAKQRIDNAVDAIRGMSEDLAEEVAPRRVLERAATRCP